MPLERGCPVTSFRRCDGLRGLSFAWLVFFGSFPVTDVPALVRCHFVDTEPRRLRLKSKKNNYNAYNYHAYNNAYNYNCNYSNNNNDTIWGGSVLTGEEPPPYSGELKHALAQAGGPTQSQLSRPMSSGHHISMEHRNS